VVEQTKIETVEVAKVVANVAAKVVAYEDPMVDLSEVTITEEVVV